MLGLRLAIPIHWRAVISSAGHGPPPLTHETHIKWPSGESSNIANLSTKWAYREIITSGSIPNSAYPRWLNEDKSLRLLDPKEWAQVCMRPFSATRDTRLQCFQYKLINRISPCRTYLKQIKIYDSDACPFCQDVDSLTHFFCDCPDTAAFWKKLQDWVDRVEDTHFSTISLKEKLLGVPVGFPKGRKINYITLLAKYYIHKQKLFANGQLRLIHWLQEFRSRLQVQKWVCSRLGKSDKFARWQKYLDFLS